jgi:hypothetical protein
MLADAVVKDTGVIGDTGVIWDTGATLGDRIKQTYIESGARVN